MKTKRAIHVALCIALCLSLNTACNHENMSRVTLYFGQIPLAKVAEKPGMLDRLVSLFLPSAHAAWTVNYTSINLTISGDDMDTITAVVPPNTVSYTIEVPMGKSRLFSLFAYDGSIKKWGGHVLADTNESEASFTMNVFPIVTNLIFGGELYWVQLRWDRVVGASGYRIYRSSNQFGPFVYIDSVDNPTEGSYAYFDEDLPETPSRYYYRVSVYYSQGEGEPCDQRSVDMPI